MKKSILFAMFIGGVVAANAQTTPGSLTTEATLNVRLYPIQTIEINNTLNNTVNLDYKTADDYKNGVDAIQPNHLKVYSTGGFFVTVKSGATLGSTGITETIAANDIEVTASAGTEKPLSGATYEQAVKLTQTAKQLFSSTTGGNNSTFNIKYSTKTSGTATSDKYLNLYKNAQNPTIYTTKVLYTIAAQ